MQFYAISVQGGFFAEIVHQPIPAYLQWCCTPEQHTPTSHDKLIFPLERQFCFSDGETVKMVWLGSANKSIIGKFHGRFSLSLAVLLLTCYSADCAAERAAYGMYTVVLIFLGNLHGLLRAASGRREVAIKMITFVWICFEWDGKELKNHIEYFYLKIPGCEGARWLRCRSWLRNGADPITERLPHKTHVSHHLVAMSIPEGA